MIIIALAFFAASCAKTVAPEGPFEPAMEFEQANAKLADNFYEDARTGFGKIKRQDTTGEYAPLAQLRIGDSYMQEEHPDLAVEEYQRFINDYPMHKYASYAQYQIGMAYFGLIDGADRAFSPASKAQAAFEELLRRFPRNPYREQAQLKIQQCREVLAEHEFEVADFYFRREGWSAVVGRLTGILRDYPEFDRLDDINLRLAVSYHALGMAEQSQRHLDMLDAKAGPLAAEARRRMQEITGQMEKRKR